MNRAKLILAALTAFTLSVAAGPSTARAMSTYYSTYCTGCHGSNTSTCNGCHMHGGQNVSGSIGKTSFAPGEAMSITVNAGTRTGWWRAAVLDQSNAVVTTATVASGLTTTLSVPAPATAGTYSWKVAWYGNQRDATPPSGASWLADRNNPNHGFQMASLPAFTVAAASTPAPVATLSAASLAFGNVTVGQSASRTTVVGNTGNATLSVTAVTPCSNTAPPYGITPNAAFTVAPAASRTLTVTFAPTSTGTFNGCFDLATNDPAHATLRVTLSGTGTAVATPSATLSPTSIAFGDVTVGQTVTKTAAVGNTGAATLSVTGVTPCDGSNSAALGVTPTAAFSVASGGSQLLTARFAPTAAGAAAACWNIATNDPAHSTLQLRATGNGVDTAPPPPPTSCGGCHSIPPDSGRHLLHTSAGVVCATCHGDGYSKTTVNTATHQNGKVNLLRSTGWKTQSRTCSNSCHDTESWFRSSDGQGRPDDDFVLSGDEPATASGGCSSSGGPMTFLALAGLGILALARRRRGLA